MKNQTVKEFNLSLAICELKNLDVRVNDPELKDIIAYLEDLQEAV